MKCLSVRANVTKEHSPYGYESLKKKSFVIYGYGTIILNIIPLNVATRNY